MSARRGGGTTSVCFCCPLRRRASSSFFSCARRLSSRRRADTQAVTACAGGGQADSPASASFCVSSPLPSSSLLAYRGSTFTAFIPLSWSPSYFLLLLRPPARLLRSIVSQACDRERSRTSSSSAAFRRRSCAEQLLVTLLRCWGAAASIPHLLRRGIIPSPSQLGTLSVDAGRRRRGHRNGLAPPPLPRAAASPALVHSPFARKRL
jgi:hypothetical protein